MREGRLRVEVGVRLSFWAEGYRDSLLGYGYRLEGVSKVTRAKHLTKELGPRQRVRHALGTAPRLDRPRKMSPQLFRRVPRYSGLKTLP